VAQESGASPEEVKSTVQREFPDWGHRHLRSCWYPKRLATSTSFSPLSLRS
jgi:hypothetical protein